MADHPHRDNPINKAFAAAWERKGEGINQTNIAPLMGKHQTDVSKWLVGDRQPPLEYLPAIEKALGLPVGTILRRAGFVEDAQDSVNAVLADPLLSRASREMIARLIVSERKAKPPRS